MILDGSAIAGYIKQRHFEQVKSLDRKPKLAIVFDRSTPASASYLKAKQAYGQDIGVEVELCETSNPARTVDKLSKDPQVTGIIVQLPLEVESKSVLDKIEPAKDIDGLTPGSPYEPATAKAILWLLNGYNIDPKGKTIVLAGHGQLVGQPLAKMLKPIAGQLIVCDEYTKDLASQTVKADIVITATGQPHLITSDMVKEGAVIIDAGSPKPEVDIALYDRRDLKVSPVPGGVGPMTVAALYDNLLLAGTSLK